MYIKLGKIVVNRSRQINDFMIFVEVVDSGMSFEKPAFVRTIDDLDIWFGKNFSSREFFIELLNNGASLFLYKPISKVSYLDSYIDIDSLDEYEEEVIYYSTTELPQVGIPNVKYNVKGTYYIYVDGPGWILFDQIGKYVDNPGSMAFRLNLKIKEFANVDSLPEIGDCTKKYKVLDVDQWYLWLNDSWISETELPQNIENASASLDNRDTLAITSTKYKNIPEYFHPQFNSNTVSDDPFTSKEIIQLPYEIILIEDKFYYNIEKVFEELPSEGESDYRYKYNSIYYTYLDNSWVEIPNSEIDNYKVFYVEVDIDSDSLINEATTLSLKNIYDDESNLSGTLGTGYLQLELLNPYSIEDGNIMLYTGYTDTKRGLVDRNNNVVVSKDNYAVPFSAQDVVDITNGYLMSGDYNVRVDRPGKELTAWSSLPIDVKNFNTYSHLTVSPDFDTTHDILSQLFLDYVDVRLWSKTIGIDDKDLSEDKYISVSIEQVDYLVYRFSISRYDYLEIFEGSLDPEPGDVRIDERISRESKLINCRIKHGIDEIRTGNYVLRRAKSETYNKDMYWKSFESIFQEEIYPDYVLIPDMQKYVSGLDENYSYYTEYLTFLDVAKELSCQFVIQNSDSVYKLEEVSKLPEKPTENVLYKLENSTYYLNGKEVTDNYIITYTTAGNDYVFNYTGDKENRLIYFFREMRLKFMDEEVVPGYYLYLLGLTSNVFSPTSKDILYDSPISYPYDLPYNIVYVEVLPTKQKANYLYVVEKSDGTVDYVLNKETITDAKLIQAVKDSTTKEKLSKYKSNYLVYNNNNYYYRIYENGVNYESTAWLRFAVGKVTRELWKNKWKYLGLRNLNTIRDNVLAVLSKVSRSFSIISNLELTYFEFKAKDNALNLSINLEVSDLINNNIILDLVINYNN